MTNLFLIHYFHTLPILFMHICTHEYTLLNVLHAHSKLHKIVHTPFPNHTYHHMEYGSQIYLFDYRLCFAMNWNSCWNGLEHSLLTWIIFHELLNWESSSISSNGNWISIIRKNIISDSNRLHPDRIQHFN